MHFNVQLDDDIIFIEEINTVPSFRETIRIKYEEEERGISYADMLMESDDELEDIAVPTANITR